MGVAPFRPARLPGISPLRMLDYDVYVDDGGAGSAREVNRGCMSSALRPTCWAVEAISIDSRSGKRCLEQLSGGA